MISTIVEPFVTAFSQLEWWQVSLIVADYILKFIALGYVPADRRPTSAMAWLLAIFLLPFIGLPLFFLIGSPYINRRRHRIQNEANALFRAQSADEPDIPHGRELSDELRSLVTLNRELTAIPATDGSLVALHTDYDDTILAMAAAVDQAQREVNVEIYIMAWDNTTAPFFEALGRAVERGVTVRLLFDHVGSWKYPGYRTLGRRLDALGIDWALMMPLQPWKWRFRRPDLRNHRKILVIDGETAFVGSQNMIDSSYLSKKNIRIGRHWVDIMAELRGPIVSTINAIFAVDWYTETDKRIDLPSPAEAKRDLESRGLDSGAEIMQTIPSGPGISQEPNLRLFSSIAHHAKQSLQLVSPYFIPDESLMEAVTTACYRGVDVELFVSEKSDQALVGHAQASYYKELLKAGVKIYLYPAPAVLHTKFVVADEEVAVMGSSNMDMRSFGLNYEISLMVGDGELLDALHRTAASYREASHLLTSEEWEQRPRLQRYLDNVSRLTSALQ